MKADNQIPDFVRLADDSTIYKGQGSKFDLLKEMKLYLFYQRLIPFSYVKGQCAGKSIQKQEEMCFFSGNCRSQVDNVAKRLNSIIETEIW